MKKKYDWPKIIGIFVFITLFFSIGYAVAKIIMTPEVATNTGEHVKTDYILMLIQCCLGIVVMGLPSIVEKKFSVDIPNYMCVIYFIFLYCSIYLGDVRNFYYIIPHWDTILHGFSGAMLGALGFTLVKILNDSERIHVVLSPIFICLFAFCFALASGVIWEIYEFCGDSMLGLNMQKYRLADGTLLIGKEALSDTMIDIIIDTVGALIVVICGYVSMKGKESYIKKKNLKNSGTEN